jgi:acylglycerol lipase
VDALDAFAIDLGRLTAPVLLLHGTADPFVPYERSLQAVRNMATQDVTVHLYEGGRHEVLNEINREEVIGDLSEWLRRVA